MVEAGQLAFLGAAVKHTCYLNDAVVLHVTLVAARAHGMLAVWYAARSAAGCGILLRLWSNAFEWQLLC